MYKVIVELPKNIKFLEEKYAEVLADIIAEEFTQDELGYLIERLENRERSLIKDNKY
ncbi:hypothetical protein [Clostridium hydrogeniformans]|uniref:hypothetical protein n=1 Tax=Clostridium hydrogeniformans TaxID=349933 RepID=UPI000A80823F|nr:hypothetical protein [Clostridium hydrogeniformans]